MCSFYLVVHILAQMNFKRPKVWEKTYFYENLISSNTGGFSTVLYAYVE